MNIKNKVLAVLIALFCMVGVYTTFTTVYDSYIKDKFDRESDEYFNGFRGGAYSFFQMDSAELDSDKYGKEVDYAFVENLAKKSLLRQYPESREWDSNYYDGFKEGYIAKYVYSYYNGD